MKANRNHLSDNVPVPPAKPPSAETGSRLESAGDPLVAAFSAGRTLNALDWELQQAFLRPSNDHFGRATDLLNQLAAVSHLVSGTGPNRIGEVVLAVRDELQDNYLSEQHHESLVEQGEDYELDGRWPRETHLRLLAEGLVLPHIRRLQSAFLESCDQGDPMLRRAFDLGECLDQGVHRADICQFLHSSSTRQRVRVQRSGKVEEEPEQPEARATGYRNPLADVCREPGELPPDDVWFQSLPMRWRSAGLSPEGLPSPLADHLADIAGLVDRLHNRIVDHLCLYDVRKALEEGTLKPVWDEDRRQLRVGDLVIKEFRKTLAPNQSTVLADFQRDGWPHRMDDPLPFGVDDPKDRLKETIKGLNNMRHKLIRFRGDGTGEGVCWEVVGP